MDKQRATIGSEYGLAAKEVNPALFYKMFRFKSPGHQWPLYWLYKLNESLNSQEWCQLFQKIMQCIRLNIHNHLEEARW